MSAIKAIVYLLTNNAPLIAVVPAARIMAGNLPQSTALPAISIQGISTTRRHRVAATQTQLCTSRVQITIHAKNYPQQQSVMALVRTALPRSRGTINGVDVDSVLHEIERDLSEDEAGIFIGQIDYMVRFAG